jgi:hypothetical protein
MREVLVSAQRIIERDFPNGQLAIDIRNVLTASPLSRPAKCPVCYRRGPIDGCTLQDCPQDAPSLTRPHGGGK